MIELTTHFVGGEWIAPLSGEAFTIVSPTTAQPIGVLHLGGKGDVDRAVSIARAAFEGFSRTSRADRLDLLRALAEEYDRRASDLADAVYQEMGAPRPFAETAQVPIGGAHITKMLETLREFSFEEDRNGYRLRKEPIGVCGLITPWNWPLNQITCKVVPALAAGCTMILKPSELAPISASIFAEVVEKAGIPHGVFNLVHGTGPVVGAAIAEHPDVDLVSFTGSTRAGIDVARRAAATVKRVHQELGGKSANVILPDADMEIAVQNGIAGCFLNSGQSCNAPTRMLVPNDAVAHVKDIARRTAEAYVPDSADHAQNQHRLGPVISKQHFDRIQDLIARGIEEGANLVTGGVGKPVGAGDGFFVKPTVFSEVSNDMTIAREEVFGPVLVIQSYQSLEEAISIANDTPYGLSAYVSGKSAEQIEKVASHIRAGTVFINSPEWTPSVPFGGYKQSGNGREYAEFGLHDFLELKGIVASSTAA